MASPSLRKLGLSHFVHPVPMLHWEGDNPNEHLMAFLEGKEDETWLSSSNYTITTNDADKLNGQLSAVRMTKDCQSCSK